MKKKELEQEVLALKENLNDIKQLLFQQRKALDFLATHDRKDVEIVSPQAINKARFLYGLNVFEQTLPLELQDISFVFSVLDNTETDCIIRADNNICAFYYKLDKTTRALVEVTEFYKRAELERMATACDLKSEKELTKEKCECKCKKGDKQ